MVVLSHLLNLIVKRFFNSKVIQEDLDGEEEEDDDEQSDYEDDEDEDETEELGSEHLVNETNYQPSQLEALNLIGKICSKIKKIVKLFNKSIQLRDSLIGRTELKLHMKTF